MREPDQILLLGVMITNDFYAFLRAIKGRNGYCSVGKEFPNMETPIGVLLIACQATLYDLV